MREFSLRPFFLFSESYSERHRNCEVTTVLRIPYGEESIIKVYISTIVILSLHYLLNPACTWSSNKSLAKGVYNLLTAPYPERY